MKLLQGLRTELQIRTPFLEKQVWEPLQQRSINKAIKRKFGGRIPVIGERVCDCRFKHQPIYSFPYSSDGDYDTVQLEDGMHCSLLHCCDPINHTILEHPEIEKELHSGLHA